MEVRPIFTVEIPADQVDGSVEMANIAKEIKLQLVDYNVLIFFTPCDKVKYEAFYAKDLIETDFETLKQMVEDKLKTTNE